jgi:dolichyl-phosphate-mannose-protein mannosyltransferase
MSNKWLITIVLVLGFFSRFLFFGHPNQTVFDEVHFGKFVSAYYTHQYYFNIHPPLGKLIIAGVGKVFGFTPEYKFETIGEKFQDNKYMALRFLPSLAGALLPLVIFLLALQVGLSRRASLLAGLFVVFENSLAVQSRFVFLDPFLILFGFTGLLFYFLFTKKNNFAYLILSGIFCSLSFSIKWTGLTFVSVIGVMEIIRVINQQKDGYEFKKVLTWFGQNILAIVIIPMLIYFSVFAIHFSLLTKSGTGDAFMSQSFQSDLSDNPNENDAMIPKLSLAGKFMELNAQMFKSNQTLTATHSYSSQWFTWPFMIRPVYYWVSDNARLYFIGNPLIWWLSTVAVIILLLRNIQFIISRDYRIKFNINKIELFLLGAYLINFLPFILIGRVMFLYHYMIALIFSILVLAYILDRDISRKTIVVIMALSIGLFVYFSPLTYGLPLGQSQYENRVWLSSWQ